MATHSKDTVFYESCKCGSQPLNPSKVLGARGTYILKCSNPKCPALVQRLGKNECMSAWNEMATRLYR